MIKPLKTKQCQTCTFPPTLLSLNNIQLSHLINFSVVQPKQTLSSRVKEPVISDALVTKRRGKGTAQSSF